MRTRRRLLSDITPLRESRQYRLLYAGELLAFLGSQLTVVLVANALRPQPLLWPLYALTAAGAGLQAVDAPARTAAIPALVRRELLPAAAALHQIVMQVGTVAGPALAGLIVARAGMAAAYAVDVSAFVLASLLAV